MRGERDVAAGRHFVPALVAQLVVDGVDDALVHQRRALGRLLAPGIGAIAGELRRRVVVGIDGERGARGERQRQDERHEDAGHGDLLWRDPRPRSSRFRPDRLLVHEPGVQRRRPHDWFMQAANGRLWRGRCRCRRARKWRFLPKSGQDPPGRRPSAGARMRPNPRPRVRRRRRQCRARHRAREGRARATLVVSARRSHGQPVDMLTYFALGQQAAACIRSSAARRPD